MTNYFKNNNKTLCCGCRGCEQICPTKCIDMVEDEEGFFYPEIDEAKCINCGLCERVCPINDGGYINKKSFEDPKTYAAYHKEELILDESTSGGAFTAIVQTYCDKDYAIFGAGFDENLVVRHSFVTDKNDIDKFRGSKYVQSEVGYSFKEAKQFLEEGNKVLFVGNPCQVAGLKNFLQKEYINLLCLDFVCHGVPSPKVFEAYKNDLMKKYNSEIVGINFRNKSKKDWLLPYMTVSFDDKKEIHGVYSDNEFIIGFYKSYYIRPVCHACPFAKVPRVSDITIADFWGIEEIKPEFINKRGTSLILLNTNKGQEVFKNIDKYLQYEEALLKDAMKYNSQLYRPTTLDPMRENFMKDFSNGVNFEDLKKRYLRKRSFIKRFISKTLSKQTKNKIKRILKLD